MHELLLNRWWGTLTEFFFLFFFFIFPLLLSPFTTLSLSLSLSLPPFSGETMEAMGACIVPFHSTSLRTWKSKFVSVGTRITFYSYYAGWNSVTKRGIKSMEMPIENYFVIISNRKIFLVYFIIQFYTKYKRALVQIATRVLNFERQQRLTKA